MANTKVRIGWVPWCGGVNHRRYFGSASEQQSWMASHLTTFSADDFTYQRENTTMDVPLNFEQLTGCNYVAYQNADYGSKWYYAFITSMQYKAKETTTLSLETDYLETWLFDFGWEAAFVEREIVTSDGIGEHTMNEGLDVGNYIQVNRDQNPPEGISLSNMYAVVMTTMYPKTDIAGGTVELAIPVGGDRYNGVYSGASLLAFPNTADFQWFTKEMTELGAADAIVGAFMVPKGMIDKGYGVTPCDNGHGVWVNSGEVAYAAEQKYSVNCSDIDGYVPKNNKLFTYPYNVVCLSDTNNELELMPERFQSVNGSRGSKEVSFGWYMVCEQNSGMMASPNKYNGVSPNYEYAIVTTGWPQVNWNVDAFSQYMTSSFIGSLANTAGTIAMMIPQMRIAGMAGQISKALSAGTVASAATQMTGGLTEAALKPNQLKGGSTSNLKQGMRIGLPYVYQKQCKADIAKAIDDRFSVYGYCIEQVKVPARTGRPCWNYVQTRHADFNGKVPEYAMDAINRMHDEGIWYWHVDDVGNFGLDNSL